MSEGRVVGTKAGQERWALEAFNVLRETAARYNATITYSELAEEVQRRSGLHTNAQQHNWIGSVLSVVVRACHRGDLPPLTSLVVHKHDGKVGDGYDEVLRVAGLSPIGDPLEREQHAAASRLECYRRYCPSVPDEAVPTLTAPVRAAVARREKVARASKPALRLPVCQRCWLEMPADGSGCQNCA